MFDTAEDDVQAIVNINHEQKIPNLLNKCRSAGFQVSEEEQLIYRTDINSEF